MGMFNCSSWFFDLQGIEYVLAEGLSLLLGVYSKIMVLLD